MPSGMERKEIRLFLWENWRSSVTRLTMFIRMSCLLPSSTLVDYGSVEAGIECRRYRRKGGFWTPVNEQKEEFCWVLFDVIKGS